MSLGCGSVVRGRFAASALLVVGSVAGETRQNGRGWAGAHPHHKGAHTHGWWNPCGGMPGHLLVVARGICALHPHSGPLATCVRGATLHAHAWNLKISLPGPGEKFYRGIRRMAALNLRELFCGAGGAIADSEGGEVRRPQNFEGIATDSQTRNGGAKPTTFRHSSSVAMPYGQQSLARTRLVLELEPSLSSPSCVRAACGPHAWS